MRSIVIGGRPEWYADEFIPKPRIANTEIHNFGDCHSELLYAAELLRRFIWHMSSIYWIKLFSMAEVAVHTMCGT